MTAPDTSGPARYAVKVARGPMAVKFAVVREDPEVELAVIDAVGARRALLVASGGCTAFAIGLARPGLAITLFDANPDQLAHVRARAAAIAAGQTRALNVDDSDPTGLSQLGAFEALFRVLATALRELVVPAEALEQWFALGQRPGAAAEAAAWFTHPCWPAIFHVAFNDALLVAIFGPDAVQHAAPGSYPDYFQAVFERGLIRPDGPTNPFLQHVLLGRYLARDAPPFLTTPRVHTWEAVLGGLPDVPALARFDVVHLSNIFDWCEDATVARWCARLRELREGAAVTVRQLHNDRDLRPFLAPWFRVDGALGARLTAADRSLFYDRVLVLVRTGEPA